MEENRKMSTINMKFEHENNEADEFQSNYNAERTNINLNCVDVKIELGECRRMCFSHLINRYDECTKFWQ